MAKDVRLVRDLQFSQEGIQHFVQDHTLGGKPTKNFTFAIGKHGKQVNYHTRDYLLDSWRQNKILWVAQTENIPQGTICWTAMELHNDTSKTIRPGGLAESSGGLISRKRKENSTITKEAVSNKVHKVQRKIKATPRKGQLSIANEPFDHVAQISTALVLRRTEAEEEEMDRD